MCSRPLLCIIFQKRPNSIDVILKRIYIFYFKQWDETGKLYNRDVLPAILRVAGGKFEPVLKDNAYKIHMTLTINSVSQADYGSYKCVSRNSLGDTDGSIKVYRKYNHAALRFKNFFSSRCIFLRFYQLAKKKKK